MLTVTKRQEERYQAVIDLLNSAGRMSVLDICQALKTSPATLRRTLERLQQQGLIIRTHGGAMLQQQGLLKPPFVERLQRFEQEKLAIAREAAKLVENHQTVFITSGSTTTLLARVLAESDKEVNVITNAANVAVELIRNPRIRAIVLGGEVGDSYSVSGEWVEPMLLRLPLGDHAFVGADGITLDTGISTYSWLDATVHKLISERARKTTILADHTKFGVSRFYQICPVSRVDTLITDEFLSRKEQALYRGAGVNLVTAAVIPKAPN